MSLVIRKKECIPVFVRERTNGVRSGIKGLNAVRRDASKKILIAVSIHKIGWEVGAAPQCSQAGFTARAVIVLRSITFSWLRSRDGAGTIPLSVEPLPA
jgi:hypothetical protein